MENKVILTKDQFFKAMKMNEQKTDEVSVKSGKQPNLYKLSDKVIGILTERLKDEYYAHYLYRAAANWCNDVNYKKAAAFFEKEAILTEKTIMSIYSGTLPIWLGGWRCADALRQFGFDVFDDIVDHSYQNMQDPFDRCYYAIQRNLHLLQDFDRARDFVQNNRARFESNLQLLKNNVFQTAVGKIKINKS
jgi:hypothetical protein